MSGGAHPHGDCPGCLAATQEIGRLKRQRMSDDVLRLINMVIVTEWPVSRSRLDELQMVAMNSGHVPMDVRPTRISDMAKAECDLGGGWYTPKGKTKAHYFDYEFESSSCGLVFADFPDGVFKQSPARRQYDRCKACYRRVEAGRP